MMGRLGESVARLPGTAALGRDTPLERRRVLIRAGVLAGLLAIALVVRATGILHPDQGNLPPLPGAAQVVPGVLRAGAPSETDLVLLRDLFRVRAVVAIGGTTVEEQAVAQGLGMSITALDVADGAAPSASQVLTLVTVVRSTTTGGGGVVFLHDATGHGPVVVTAAMVQLVAGSPLADVLARLSPEERRDLSVPQSQALRDAADALSGGGAPNNPYAALRKVPR